MRRLSYYCCQKTIGEPCVMNIAPEKQQQVLQVHAGLIVTIVKALNDPSLMPNVEQVLKISEENGWGQLVTAIRRVIKGDRDKDRKSTRLNSSHRCISYAVFCLKKKKPRIPSNH